jgi:hypothetical protein
VVLLRIEREGKKVKEKLIPLVIKSNSLKTDADFTSQASKKFYGVSPYKFKATQENSKNIFF